jgi:hypothetical protein
LHKRDTPTTALFKAFDRLYTLEKLGNVTLYFVGIRLERNGIRATERNVKWLFCFYSRYDFSETLNTLLSTQLGGRFSRRQPRRTEDAVVKARTL